MNFFIAFLALVYLSYKVGREDGKWGCFAVIIGLVIFAIIATLFE